MCLAVPGRIVDVYRDRDLLMAKVEFGGIARPVCLEHTPEAAPGDYVLVHVGFALARIDEQEARRTFELLAEIGALETDVPDGDETP